MKKLLLLLALALALTSCGASVNKERVDKLVFDYTEHMEIYEREETDAMASFVYLGNSTVSLNDGNVNYVVATRLNKSNTKFAILGIFGELHNGLFEDGSFDIYEIGVAKYEIKSNKGYSIALEITPFILDELIKVNFSTYMEELKELTYDDIVYAFNKLYIRNY